MPEFEGVGLFFRKLTYQEREVWRAHAKSLGDEETANATIGFELLVNTLCDESGERIYGQDDIERLREVASADTIDLLVEKSLQLNGLGAKAQADLEKNSKTTTSGESSSE